MSESISSYFLELKQLIHKEWKAEREFHFDKLAQLSPDQRRAKGYSWFPLEVIEHGYQVGQRPYIIFRRTKALKVPHEFRSGSRVELYPLKESDGKRITGMIRWVDRDKMNIIFSKERLPDWVFGASLAVDVFFDERSYKAMDAALATLSELEASRLKELTKCLLGIDAPFFSKHSSAYFNAQLNDSQNEAIDQIIRAEDYAVIHGPPGTGKTTTLVAAIKQMAAKESPILVCAPSNTAVDHLLVKLSEAGLNAVRIGNLSRIHDKVQNFTLDAYIEAHPDAKSIKTMKKDVSALRKKASSYKRNFGSQEAHERRNLYREAGELSKLIRLAEDHLVHSIIDRSDVICTTLVGSDSSYLRGKSFQTVIIDEAAQALEPACWIPILKASRVIMAGDPYQLPPTVKSQKGGKAKGLFITLMEKLVQRENQGAKGVFLLNTQYRMNEQIMAFSSHYFYEKQLIAHESVKYQTLISENKDEKPLEFIDTAGCGFDEKRNPVNLSTYNPEEYQLLGVHLTALLSSISDTDYTVAIITPYREQVNYIKENLTEHFLAEHAERIDVNTVDAFQGQERDIIYISMVRSNSRSDIGFLKDYRRMNVAMTRARKKLVIVGDSATLGEDPFYSKFVDFAQESESYFSAWEWI